MEHCRIGFIGAGNMATSLIGGLLADGFPAHAIQVHDVDREKLQTMAERFGVETSTDNATLVTNSDVVVFAVKPQQIRMVAEAVALMVQHHQPLIVSIAAGIREQDLERWLGGQAAIVRAMPNTPALVQSGATGLHANAGVKPQQKDQAESLLRAVGVTIWVGDEELLDAVTAVSGSGPAYFFLLMEAMEKAGVNLGLEEETARLLVEQTALGAAKLALEANVGPGELRSRVTSPGGTTEKAVAVLEHGGFQNLVRKALQVAHARSRDLSNQLREQE